MATWFIASKLSSFSSSLLSSTPSVLPTVPTLAELQKHAESARSVFVDSLPSLPTYPATGGVASTKQPPPAVSISHSVRQPVRPWSNSPPPPYVHHSTPSVQYGGAEGEDGDRSRSKLKKGRIGWRRVQGKIPDEEVIPGPTMSGSRGYVGNQGRYDRMSGGQNETEKAQDKTFWQWVTCQ